MNESMSMDAEEPLQLFPAGRFRIEGNEGQGGQGLMVLRAWDAQLHRFVACKLFLNRGGIATLAPEEFEEHGLTEDEGEALVVLSAIETRYTPVREARLLARIEHPNVISAIDVGLLDIGTVALVMPYLEGGTLEGWTHKGSWEHVLDIAMQIGRGLAAIHDAQLLHRDIKPANILFNRAGRPVIVDLGLAAAVSDDDALRERVGTPEYMAPEVVTRGYRDVRDDLYSYCMVVYEMFYGQPPFKSVEQREAGRVATTFRRGGMPRRLRKAIIRGLAPDANERWSSMKALLREFEQLRQPARRRIWAAAGLGLTAGLALSAFAVERTAQADECSEVMNELDAIWSPDVLAELYGATGTRMVGESLEGWAQRWVEMRMRECEVAQDDDRSTYSSPCSTTTREHFNATIYALRTPHMRSGLRLEEVIGGLPSPEYCLEHPEDAEYGYGGLLELRQLEGELRARVGMGDLELAADRQADYMTLALELGSDYGAARAMFWRGEILRQRGEFERAKRDFYWAYERAQELDVEEFGGEVQMKLAAIAGAMGEFEAVDMLATSARSVFQAYRPDRVAEVLQVHGLALLSDTGATKERGVELLQRAVELRGEELRRGYGRRAPLSVAQENYARALLEVGRSGEAIEYVDLALEAHYEEFGHRPERTRDLLRLKFRGWLQLERDYDADVTSQALLDVDEDAEDWSSYVEDALWLADIYAISGAPESAVIPLIFGREVAAEHDLLDAVARIDIAIRALSESDGARD